MSNESRESRELEPYRAEQALVSVGNAGTLALAIMSDVEFAARLAALRQGASRIEAIKRELMKRDEDYGIIPGTPKPTLYKPGAEKLGDFFGLRADFEAVRTVGDGVTSPPISYRVRCLLHLGSLDGPIVATGEGSANSWERKHRYRSAERTCPKCGSMKSIIKGKEEFGGGWLCFAKKGGCGAKFGINDPAIVGQQLGEIENPDPWDLDNTLLKMAEKRSYVDGILRGTASSGLFTQDMEDAVSESPEVPEETRQARRDAAPYTPPKAETPGFNTAPTPPKATPAPAPEAVPPAKPLPEDPEAAAAAMSAEIDAQPPIDWGQGEDLEAKITDTAKKIAITLKQKGLSDAHRALLYHALTTFESGKDMTPAQLVVLQIHAGEIPALRAIAEWWRQNRPGTAAGEVLL